MNFVGAFMFVAVGGTALHYWHGYQPEQKFVYDAPERQVRRIIEMMRDERDSRDSAWSGESARACLVKAENPMISDRLGSRFAVRPGRRGVSVGPHIKLSPLRQGRVQLA